MFGPLIKCYKTFVFKLKIEKPFIASIFNCDLIFSIRVPRFLYAIEGNRNLEVKKAIKI